MKLPGLVSPGPFNQMIRRHLRVLPLILFTDDAESRHNPSARTEWRERCAYERERNLRPISAKERMEQWPQ